MNHRDKLKLCCRLPITFLRQVCYKKPNVMSDIDTVNYILDHKCSVARYGDGEMDLMLGIGIKFQSANKKLQLRLKEIAKSKQTNCLICIPNVFLKKKFLYKIMVKKDAKWWLKYLLFTRGDWYIHFKDIKYGDTNISRFYMEINDKQRTEVYIKNIKKIWDGLNVIFVEGEKSRLGVGNDLFDNAASIKRIICPSQNAFDKYDEILSEVIELTNPDDLIICALGPTATVLCYDLSQIGRRALDLGHIDIEYEWYRMGATEKVSITGKDVSESSNDLRNNIVQLSDSVIARIL